MCQVLNEEVSSDLFQTICQIAQPMEFKRDFALVYKGQVPNVGIVLVSGKVQVKDDTGVRDCDSKCLIAFRELLSGVPSGATVWIRQGAVASLIDREVLTMYLESRRHLQLQILEGKV